jgi:broad specificity phosphatase PhoE
VTKILLIRHGHVEGIQPARFRGRAELHLTSRGFAEAEAVAQRIASAWKPSMVYTSPLSRCVATGEVIAKAEPLVIADLTLDKERSILGRSSLDFSTRLRAVEMPCFTPVYLLQP